MTGNLLQHAEQMPSHDKQLLGLLVELLRLLPQLQFHGARMKLRALRCRRHVEQLLQLYETPAPPIEAPARAREWAGRLRRVRAPLPSARATHARVPTSAEEDEDDLTSLLDSVAEAGCSMTCNLLSC